MGWPRVVTGAAARILSMVMDIARASVRRSDRANVCEQQSSSEESKGNEQQIAVAYAACLMELAPPFPICAELPCHLPAGQCWRGQLRPCVTRCGATAAATDVAAWMRRGEAKEHRTKQSRPISFSLPLKSTMLSRSSYVSKLD